MSNCKARTEVYSRVVGFFRPVQAWNKGKKEEFEERIEYQNPKQKVLAKKSEV